MEIQCKDFRNIILTFLESGIDRLYEYILKFAFPEKTTNLFAYDHITAKYPCDGWKVYDSEQEFRRIFGGNEFEKYGWRVSTINEDFSFSKSYPKRFLVPLTVTDEELKKVGEFRSKSNYFKTVILIYK